MGGAHAAEVAQAHLSPGAEEDSRIALSRQRVANAASLEETKQQSDALATEQEELNLALHASREDFDRQEVGLDRLFSEHTEIALLAADSEQTSQEMLLGAEQRDLEEALARSTNAACTHDEELERALALSTGAAQDPELEHALHLSKTASGRRRLSFEKQ